MDVNDGPTDPTPRRRLPDSARITRALRLTGAGLWWESLARAFWPVSVVLIAVFAALWLGLAGLVPPVARLPVVLVAALATLLALVRGLRRLRLPRRGEALARVDSQLPGRPLSALADRMALGQTDPGAGVLWDAHRRQMAVRAESARPVPPDAGLRRRDPFALRLAALTALAMALIFGGATQLGQGVAALAAGFRPPERPGAATGPGWEGWAEPPAYTRRPTIYLNAQPEDATLELPKGSRILFRLYGENVVVDQSIGTAVPGDDATAPEFRAEQSGLLTVAGRRFPVVVLPDDAPTAALGDIAERRADGRLVQPFTAQDDHGVTSGVAEITLDLARIDRRHGLATDPEPRDPIRINLPIPPGQGRQEVRVQISADLSRHAWANLPVQVRLQVQDGIGQQGDSAATAMVLPGRRFFDPLAAALIELRRDLLWNRDNAASTSAIMRAAIWMPDGFVGQPLLDELRGIVGQLEAGGLTDAQRDGIAQKLWDAAVELEDGGLNDALERMQQAQERLSEAIRNGASPEEVQRLMNELRRATDAYMDLLAELSDDDQAERFTRNQQTQAITGDQIQQMMDEIQRLMNEGRMAEAQALLEQFNRMMENMRVSRQQGGEGEGQDGEGGLGGTLREQQRLSDETFRQLQDRFNGEGGGEGSTGDLADQQRDLREDLERQRGLLPGRGTEGGTEARRQLDEAGRAMREAEEALRRDDEAGAIDRQAEALDAMRRGMRALNNQQQGQSGEQQGESEQPGGQARGSMQGASGFGNTDPLGRQLSGDGGIPGRGDQLAQGIDPAARARELLDEIRRRLGQQNRPQDERDYLDRLLDRF